MTRGAKIFFDLHYFNILGLGINVLKYLRNNGYRILIFPGIKKIMITNGTLSYLTNLHATGTLKCLYFAHVILNKLTNILSSLN